MNPSPRDALRVLHVLYNFVPDKTGSTSRSLGLLVGLAENGVQVFVVSSPFQPGLATNDGWETVDGLPVYRTRGDTTHTIRETYRGLRYRLQKLVRVTSFAVTIRRIVREKEIDLVHAHSNLFCYMSSRIAVISLAVPVVYEVRSLWYERFKDNGTVARLSASLIARVERLCAVFAQHVFVINESLKEHLVKARVDSNKITVVENAVSDSILREGRRAGPRSEADVVFGYAGNLSVIEGLEDLIEAFVHEFKPIEAVRLVFLGTGAYEDTLLNVIRAKRDSRISMAGEFSAEDLAEVYDSLDVVVLPRRRSLLTETVTPLKPLEALAFGRQLVLSDVGGHREIVSGLAEVQWFEAGSVADLQRALRVVYAQREVWRQVLYQDYLKGFVSQNRAWSSVAKKYLGVYARLVSARDDQ